MGYYLIFLVTIPVIIVIVSKFLWPHEITSLEWLAQFAGLVISTGLCALLISSAMVTSDFNILNGEVLSKNRDKVSCEHQYVCGQICSGDPKTPSCSPVFCDEHNYDVDWSVKTSVGNLEIERIDKQGVRTPPRWLAVKIGEPASLSQSVTNYMFIDKDRFTTTKAIHDKYEGKLPKYPRVFDYYRYNRVITDTTYDVTWLNAYLNDKLRTDGSLKQLNIIIVITNNPDDYFPALMESWRGVRKNDVAMVYGVDNNYDIKWFKATSFAEGEGNQSLLEKLKVASLGEKLNNELILNQYKLVIDNFKRLPNHKFEYLKSSYSPPMWAIIMAVVLNIIVTLAIALIFKEKEVF